MKQAIANEKKISVSVRSGLMALKERMVLLRKEKKLTQGQLAEELGVSRSYVAAWENGDRIPDLQNLKDMAVLCNVSGDYLLGFVEGRSETKSFERF